MDILDYTYFGTIILTSKISLKNWIKYLLLIINIFKCFVFIKLNKYRILFRTIRHNDPFTVVFRSFGFLLRTGDRLLRAVHNLFHDLFHDLDLWHPDLTVDRSRLFEDPYRPFKVGEVGVGDEGRERELMTILVPRLLVRLLGALGRSGGRS